MSRHRVPTALRCALEAFRRSERANVTIMFALATIPMMGFVGAAVDYSRANSVKAAMQAAADATALMLSREVHDMNNAQIQTKAKAYFDALLNRSEARAVQVSASYSTSDGSRVMVDASSRVNAEFMKLMGFSELNVSVQSQVRWGNSRLRVALALDVTGSMASAGKMAAMKTAAKGFLTQLRSAASKEGDVYVSIVPFAKEVNFGTGFRTNTTDIRWDLFSSSDGDCTGASSSGGNNGKGKGKGKGNSGSSDYDNRSDCERNGGTWTPDNSSWDGCVGDRDKDYDTTNTAPSSSIRATQFPAVEARDCPEPLIQLSSNWQALNRKVDDLQPVGMTNQTIGLQVAFQTLTASPFTVPAKEPNYEYSDVIVLMTDGDNTENRFGDNRQTIDSRTTRTCNNVKAAGIILYTVQVNTSGGRTQEFLRACASSPDKFFLLTSASQLSGTFQQIGTSLSNLRVSK